MENTEDFLLKMFEQIDQGHIIKAYNEALPYLRQKFIKQILRLNETCPGGLKGYYQRAKKLAMQSQSLANPYVDYDVSLPSGIDLDFNNLEQIQYYETIGMKQISNTAFILVAGGLGERLGYPGIKISIPFQLLTKQSFIEYYIKYILSFQQKYCKDRKLPFLIMTSDDTHDKTVDYLKNNSYFGMDSNQITLLKQEKVPAICNPDAHYSIISNQDKLELETKPHGHGDIHHQMFKSGKSKQWLDNGIKWIIFFQDTNPLSFRNFLALLGVSVVKKYEFNTIAVSRRIGQTVGAITSLTHKQTKKKIIANVEYNQVQGFFKQSGGEPTDENGVCLHPGITNSFLIDAKSYHTAIRRVKGIVDEFINPKYSDSTKTSYKSSTRLECMMQQYTKILENCDHVGYTKIDKQFCYTNLKNHPQTAIQKFQSGLPAQSGGSCQAQFYMSNRKMLQLCGANIQEDEPSQYGQIILKLFPLVFISPRFATCLTEMRTKVKKMKITRNSSIILNADAPIQNLTVDGHYCLDEGFEKQKLPVNEIVNNKDYKKIVEVSGVNVEPYLKLRGYTIQ